MRLHRHDHRLIDAHRRTSGSRDRLLGGAALAATLLIGCGGGDGSASRSSARPAPEPRAVTYAQVTAIPLGTLRPKVEAGLGEASHAATERFAIDARERASCAFYPLKGGGPDAVRLCYDAKGRLESTSTLDADRQAPDEPATAGDRDESIGEAVGPTQDQQPESPGS